MRQFLIVTIVSTLIIIVTYFLPSGVWAEFGGLPAHPLIIHAVVVLLPLLAILLLMGILMAFLAVSTIGMTYVVGHSGAESVWKYRYESGKEQQELP